MLGISIVTTHGQRVTLPDQQLAELKASFGDRLVTPGSRGYDEARTIWNGMIHRRPALIARCETAAEVQQAVRVAAASNLLVSIKGGGHNIAGNALCHDGLMIDLSPMKRVVVDAAARTARVQPGATLAELDAATQAHGLAVPLGINSGQWGRTPSTPRRPCGDRAPPTTRPWPPRGPCTPCRRDPGRGRARSSGPAPPVPARRC